jgi:hypothetical protein
LEKILHADFCLVAGGRFELPVEPDFIEYLRVSPVFIHMSPAG